jgi:DNA-binding NtrC family response regulator
MLPPGPVRFEGLLSGSPRMHEVFAICQEVGSSGATVLVVGDTGTGKELVARAIHRRSGRRGRFVALNCASVPHQLIESELFGHERGAFTGADRAKLGAVRHAAEGTLFLDEIGDLPAEGQGSLLRFLQEGTVRPVGAWEEVPVDVRVVAATHIQLRDAVEQGAFREDLYYRLDVLRIQLPPMRERAGDARLLLSYFIKRRAQRYKREAPPISESFWEALARHPLPGNVRQLQSLAERIVLSRRHRALRAADLPKLVDSPVASHLSTARPAEPLSPRAQKRIATPEELGAQVSSRFPIDVERSLVDNVERAVREVERSYLIEALTRANGRIADAATVAGISRRTLHRKLQDLGLDKAQFKLDLGRRR